ncbi:hypothetical protein D3C73_1298780 [compost metagenome]
MFPVFLKVALFSARPLIMLPYSFLYSSKYGSVEAIVKSFSLPEYTPDKTGAICLSTISLPRNASRNNPIESFNVNVSFVV